MRINFLAPPKRKEPPRFIQKPHQLLPLYDLKQER